MRHSQKPVLKNHIPSNHEKKKPFNSYILILIFTKTFWKNHIAVVHEGKKPLKCDIWDATLQQKKHTSLIHNTPTSLLK